MELILKNLKKANSNLRKVGQPLDTIPKRTTKMILKTRSVAAFWLMVTILEARIKFGISQIFLSWSSRANRMKIHRSARHVKMTLNRKKSPDIPNLQNLRRIAVFALIDFLSNNI